MLKPKWVRYSKKDTDIKNAVKISEDSGKTVLVARSKVKEGKNGSVCRLGEFILGAQYATVFNSTPGFNKVKDFEILSAPEGYFQWVECYGGYVPKFAVCSGTSLLHDEPTFLGRKWMNSSGERDRGTSEHCTTYCVGIIVPSYHGCFSPIARNVAGGDDYRGASGHDLFVMEYGHYTYEVLQVVSQERTATDGLHGLVVDRMDDGQLLDKLTQLFQLHFHGTDRKKFHQEISKLWAMSGLDSDFFFPKALPRLLDLAQVYRLPGCFLQCLKQLLMTIELSTEERIRFSIKLVRLFKYSALTKFSESGRIIDREHHEDLEPLQRHFEQLTMTQEGTAQQVAFTELMQAIQPSSGEHEHLIGRQESIIGTKLGKAGKSRTEDERRSARMRQKSLLSPSHKSRAPIPHSVMIQQQADQAHAAVGTHFEIQNDQLVHHLEGPEALSTLKLADWEKQVEELQQASNCTQEVAAILKLLLVACQRHVAMSETDQGSSWNGTECNQEIETQPQVTTPHTLFSSLLTFGLTGGPSSGKMNAVLYSLLDQYVNNEFGGTWEPGKMSDLVEGFKAQVPNQMKSLLAKSFILSLNRFPEELFATVKQSVFHFLVTHATSECGRDLLPAVTWILTHSPTSQDQLDSALFDTLTDFLKNMDEQQFLKDDSAVPSTLRLIAQKCRTFSMDMIQIAARYLDSGSSQTGHVYSAKLLNRAAVETNVRIGQDQLNILQKSLHDPNPCIKFNARVAFAAQINKQKGPWTLKKFSYTAELTEIIATEPVVLTLAGQKPEYYTYSINLPILQTLNYYRVQQGKSQWKVIQCMNKLFGKGTRLLETLTPGWEETFKEGLKFLSIQKDPIRRSVFEAVEKVFVEQDNSSVLPACAKFICACVERELNSEHVTFGSQFLEQLCLRLSRPKSDSCTYFECLHWIRELQELPDAFFHLYHLEAGAIRFRASSSRFSNEAKLVNKLQMALPKTAADGVLGWIQSYLSRGFVLSKGITDAYRSKEVFTSSMKESLTAAARSGQVIPEDLLSKALTSFPSSSLDEKDFVLSRACLKNQSLPDQVLIKSLDFLRNTGESLAPQKTVEQCLTLICSSYLLNRKFCTFHKSRSFFSVSQIRELFGNAAVSSEDIFDTLSDKFITLDTRRHGELHETVTLFDQAKELARKNRGEDSTISTVVANRSEEEEFGKLIADNISQQFSRPWNAESLQRLVLTLRSNSGVREHVIETLKACNFESHWHSDLRWPLTDNVTFVDVMPFARAVFVSMVTSSTEDAAKGCSKILELICSKFYGKDRRLLYVRASLGRMEKLGVTLHEGMKTLLEGTWHECLLPREGRARPWKDIEDLLKQSPSLFYRPLDFIRFGSLCPKKDPLEPSLRHGDLLEQLISASQNSESLCAAGIGERDARILFTLCQDSECSKYNCSASFLVECVQEYVMTRATTIRLPFQLKDDERRADLTDLVYRAVISLLTETIQKKLPDRESTDSLKRNQESIMVLAAELLESFYHDLPKLNFFLSKLSTVDMDTMWTILPSLYNVELDFNKLDVRGDGSGTDFEPEEIRIEFKMKGDLQQHSSDLYSKHSAQRFLSCGLKLLLRQDYGFHHFFGCWSTDKLLEQTEAVLRLAVHRLDPFDYSTVSKVREVVDKNGPDFLSAVNKHIQGCMSKSPESVLSLPELVSQLAMAKGTIGALAEPDLLATLKEIVESGDRRNIWLGNNKRKSASSLTRRDIKRWSNHVRGKKKIDPSEAICVSNRVVKLWRSWDLTIVQILAILLGLSQPSERKLLLELSTGSGKSTVIGILAAIKVLQGNKVDVFTSNHLLARRDAQNWKDFYDFFSLTCSSNGVETVTYDDGRKACYSSDIVYGDINQFQYDTLRTEFKGLETRGSRPYVDVIIDEVDSILLDEGSRLAMLSSTFSGMDKLQPIYHLIRSALIQFDSDQTYYCLDGALYYYKGGKDPKYRRDFLDEENLFEPRREYLKRNIEDYIRVLLGIQGANSEDWKMEEHFQLPPHLLEYSTSQVSNWAEAAITAESLEENKDYMVVANKVVPIDPNSGVLQESGNWTNGLHQFLQIKHELDFTAESPTTNFLSNTAMVNKYKKGMVGLTGTLGSRESFQILSDNLKADCIPIPDVFRSKFAQFPNLTLRKRQDWREAIVYRTKLEVGLGRGVLIICETVKQAKGLYSLLAKTKGIPWQVKLHARSDNWMEHHLQYIQPRDVIVTTNLGTRGLDIQTSAIEGVGGLHVILAYMPPNTRIVRQAFGRTARKGNTGTGHLIIKQKDGTIESADIMKRVTESEVNVLKNYFSAELPSISFKDEVYSDFVAQYSRSRQKVLKCKFEDEQSLEEYGRKIVRRIVRKADELNGEKFIILEAIQDLWAGYLKLIIDPRSRNNQGSGQDALENLLAALKLDWQDPKDTKELFRITGNCYHLTRYGFQIYRKLDDSRHPIIQKCLNKAEEFFITRVNQLSQAAAGYFSAALATARTMTPAASAGISYVLLKRCSNLDDFGSPHANYKVNALRHLRSATETLRKDIGYYRDCKELLSNPLTSALANQLKQKIKALEAYMTALEKTSRTVKLSLRPIEITAAATDKTYIISISDGTEPTAKLLDDIFVTHSRIELAFHGLKVNKDIDGYSYQAQSAVQLLYDKINETKGPIDWPTVALVIDCPDIDSFLGSETVQKADKASSDAKSTKNESKSNENALQWNQFPDLMPSFQLKFSSVDTLDKYQGIIDALKFQHETPSSKIIFKAADDIASDLSRNEQLCSSAVRRSKLVTKTIDASNPHDTFDEDQTNQFTVEMTDLNDTTRKYVIHELVNRKISFDVFLEGAHLEDEQVAWECQKYLRACSQVAILVPGVSKETHGTDTEGKQKQIIQAVGRYCKAFQLKHIVPTLKISGLGPILANALLCGVDRASEPMELLELIPLRSAENLSAEALHQMEQQGLFLVASFAEKNAIPKKAIALVGSVAMAELIAGVALCTVQSPLGITLIMMAFKEAWKTKGLYQQRKFSLVKYALEKVVQVVEKGLGAAIEILLEPSLNPGTGEAKSLLDVQKLVTEKLNQLTIAQIIQSPLLGSARVSIKLIFLYFEHGGLKDLTVETMKERLQRSPPLHLTLPLLQDSNVQELWATYRAMVKLVLKKDAKAEFELWLQKLEQEQLWCTGDADGARLVEWESLRREFEGRKGNFGQFLRTTVEDTVVYNAGIYCKLACTKVLEEFKYHCVQICLHVLESLEFQPDEVEFIKKEMNIAASSPVSAVIGTLENKDAKGIIEPDKLKAALDMFRRIKRFSPCGETHLQEALKVAVLDYLKRESNSLEVLHKMILKTAPMISGSAENIKCTIVPLQGFPGPTRQNQIGFPKHSPIPLLTRQSTWEDSGLRRLMQKVSLLPTTPEEVPEEFLMHLPTLIILLHEIKVDAMLFEDKLDGNTNVPCVVIVYKLAADPFLLESLTVVSENEKINFRSSNLVVEAVSYIGRDLDENIRSRAVQLVKSEAGKKIYCGLRALCQTVMDKRRQTAASGPELP